MKAKKFLFISLLCLFTVFPAQSKQAVERLRITADNLSNLSEVASVGVGSIQDMHWMPDGNSLLVITDAGFHFYNTTDFDQEPRFIEDETGRLRFHHDTILSPDGRFLMGAYGSLGIPEQSTNLDVWDIENGTYYAQISLPEGIPDLEWGSHNAGFREAVFSPDSQTLIIGTYNGYLYRWDIEEQGATVVIDDTQTEEIWTYHNMAFTPDGRWLITFRNSDRVHIWDTETWEIVADISQPDRNYDYYGDFYAVSADSQRLITLMFTRNQEGRAENHFASIWSIPDGDLLGEYEISEYSVIGFTADDIPIAITSTENSVSLFELESGITHWTQNGSRAYWGYIMPDRGRAILTFAGGGGLNLAAYNLSDGTKTLDIFSTMRILAISPDSKLLAIAGHTSQDVSGWMAEETLLRVFDLSTGEAVYQTGRHAVYLDTYTVNADGTLIGLGQDDARILLWDTNTWQLSVLTSPNETYRVMPRRRTLFMQFVDSREILLAQVTSSNGTTISAMWDTQEGTVVEEALHYLRSIFSMDDNLLLTTDMKYREGYGRKIMLNLRDSATFQVLGSYPLDEYAYWGNPMAFSPDSSLAAVAGVENKIYIWATTPFEQSRIVHSPMNFSYYGQPTSMEFSPDNQLLIIRWQSAESGDNYHRLKLLPLTNTAMWKVWANDTPLRDIAFSPDGSYFATVGKKDFTLRFWDSQSGDELTKMGSLEEVYNVTFSPDGALLLVETVDRSRYSPRPQSILFWDIGKGEVVGQLPGHAVLYDPRFSEDMTLLIARSTGRRLIVYQIEQ